MAPCWVIRGGAAENWVGASRGTGAKLSLTGLWPWLGARLEHRPDVPLKGGDDLEGIRERRGGLWTGSGRRGRPGPQAELLKEGDPRGRSGEVETLVRAGRCCGARVTSAGRATGAPGDASEAEWVVAGDRSQEVQAVI